MDSRDRRGDADAAKAVPFNKETPVVTNHGGRDAGMRYCRSRAELVELARHHNIPLMVTVPLKRMPADQGRYAYIFTRRWGVASPQETLYACLGASRAEAYLLGRIHAKIGLAITDPEPLEG